MDNVYINLAGFLVCSSIIIYSGTKLSYYGDKIAELTGMGKAWVGLILMASVTSLPFVDGNGRVTRIAKNWMLMYDLYPPIFINDATQKKEYITTLSNSFKELMKQPDKWNDHTNQFFDQELDRLLLNASFLYESINLIGLKREKLITKNER